MTKARMRFVASRGFAMDVRTLRSIMFFIANDGRRGFPNGIPSAEVVRSFRARNRDITLRNAENKENAKLKRENYHHVKIYADVLRVVEKAHDGMFSDGNRFCNLDETAVDAEY